MGAQTATARRPPGARVRHIWLRAGHAVRKIHERELADHDVKTRVLKWKRCRIALSPFYLGLSSRCDRQHPLIEIQANDLTFLPDPPESLACEHACPAANVENFVARPYSSGVSNRASPSTKDRRYEAGLVDFGSVR